MTSSRVALSELASLNDVEYRARMRSLVAVPSSQKVVELTAEIARFEAKLGISSEVMRSRLAAGELKEILDVCYWLMALQLRAWISTNPDRRIGRWQTKPTR